MASGAHPETVGKNKERLASGISGGILLICLGVLLATGWWWPGIMVALGLTFGSAQWFRGETGRGIGTLIFFCGFAVIVELVKRTDVDWVIIAAFIIIGFGVISLVKALMFRR
jgi:hypothetical protein